MSLEDDALFSVELERRVVAKTREAITDTLANSQAKRIEFTVSDLTKDLVVDWFHEELKPVVLAELNNHKADIAKVVVEKTVTTILETVAGALAKKLSDPDFVRTVITRW